MQPNQTCARAPSARQVTDIYEWGWGQSFHFSPKLPGKDWAASEAAHEARIPAILGLEPGEWRWEGDMECWVMSRGREAGDEQRRGSGRLKQKRQWVVNREGAEGGLARAQGGWG